MLTRERRDEMTAELSKLCLEAGVTSADVRAQEQHLATQSDAGFVAYVEAATKWRREQMAHAARADSQASAVRAREFEQITDADRQQAADELAVLYSSSKFSSPHARTDEDEDEHTLAVVMRARSIARQRVARKDADRRYLATPRRTAPEIREHDPLIDGAGIYASPPPGQKKGRK